MNFTEFFYDKFKDKKFAFLSPYACKLGGEQTELINGITGVPLTFKETGVNFYHYHDIKNLSDGQLKEIFKEYDYFIYPVYPEYFKLLIRLKPLYKGKILGVTDIQTHILSYWSLDDIYLFAEALPLYDYIMCTNVDEVDTFRVCLENLQRCAYTGWSMYPEKLHFPFIKKQREYGLIGVGISNPGDFNRDLLTNLAVYNKLKERFSRVKGFMYYVTPNKRAGLEKILKKLNVKDFTLVDELTYKDAIEYLSNAFIAIHMYTFKVVARLTQDCAALGVPMVGTIANLPNRLCFPETSVKDYFVEEAVNIATRLLSDKYFYEKVANYAIESVKFYNLENTQRRIWALLEGDKNVK